MIKSASRRLKNNLWLCSTFFRLSDSVNPRLRPAAGPLLAPPPLVLKAWSNHGKRASLAHSTHAIPCRDTSLNLRFLKFSLKHRPPSRLARVEFRQLICYRQEVNRTADHKFPKGILCFQRFCCGGSPITRESSVCARSKVRRRSFATGHATRASGLTQAPAKTLW